MSVNFVTVIRFKDFYGGKSYLYLIAISTLVLAYLYIAIGCHVIIIYCNMLNINIKYLKLNRANEFVIIL